MAKKNKKKNITTCLKKDLIKEIAATTQHTVKATAFISSQNTTHPLAMKSNKLITTPTVKPLKLSMNMTQILGIVLKKLLKEVLTKPKTKTKQKIKEKTKNDKEKI